MVKNAMPSVKGMPDLTGGYRGHPFMIEVKRKGKGGVISPAQKVWIKKARANGYIAGVCSTVEEFLELYNDYLQSKKV